VLTAALVAPLLVALHITKVLTHNVTLLTFFTCRMDIKNGFLTHNVTLLTLSHVIWIFKTVVLPITLLYWHSSHVIWICKTVVPPFYFCCDWIYTPTAVCRVWWNYPTLCV